MKTRIEKMLYGIETTAKTSLEKALKYFIEHLPSGSGDALPAVTGDDNGKVLGVSSGEWAAVSPPTGLPAVTGSDNGKVLGVSGGAWGAVASPGALIVNVLIGGDTPFDVSWADIAAAWAAGREIYLQLEGKRAPVIELFPTGEDAGFTASLTSYMSENTGLIFTVNYSASDGELETTNHSFSVTEVTE